MRPSERQQKPKRKPTPRYSPERADRMVAALAQEMIAYVATLYEHAPEEDRLDIILRYGPTLHTLQETIGKVTRRQRRQRRFPDEIETKGA